MQLIEVILIIEDAFGIGFRVCDAFGCFLREVGEGELWICTAYSRTEGRVTHPSANLVSELIKACNPRVERLLEGRDLRVQSLRVQYMKFD